jgi:hypothetical protein
VGGGKKPSRFRQCAHLIFRVKICRSARAAIKSARGLFCSGGLLRPSFLDGLRKMRTGLEQDLERESRGAAGREQMPRLPEVCVRVGQIRCFGLVEAKPFELIDPPQEALAVRTRLKSLTTVCFAVLHISPRRVDNSFRRLSQDYAQLNWCGSWCAPDSAGRPLAIATGIAATLSRNVANHENDQALRPRVDERHSSVAPLSKPILLRACGP